jgi:hypothetical protein
MPSYILLFYLNFVEHNNSNVTAKVESEKKKKFSRRNNILTDGLFEERFTATFVSSINKLWVKKLLAFRPNKTDGRDFKNPPRYGSYFRVQSAPWGMVISTFTPVDKNAIISWKI